MTDFSALPTLEFGHTESGHASIMLALTQQLLSILQEQHGYDVSQINQILDPNGIMNRGKIFDLQLSGVIIH